MNKIKGYLYTKTTVNLRKNYFDIIKDMDISITAFLDKAIGRQLDVLNKSDEWILTEIDAHTKTIDNLKTLLGERKKDRETEKLVSKKLLNNYKKFCDYLCGNSETYNTKRVNAEFGVNLSGFAEFKELQLKHENGSFSIDDYQEMISK